MFEDVRRAELAGECRPGAIETTDGQGQFVVDGLCPGSYSLVLTTFPGLDRVEGVYSVPSQNVEITLDGYLLEVHLVDVSGAPMGESVVTADYLRDLDPRGGRWGQAYLGVKTKPQGIAFLPLPAPGRCTSQEGSRGL
jgi:hypothetical protein